VHLCQSRADTTGDRAISVRISREGDLEGDALSHYLVEGAGDGIRIDGVLAADPRGRYVVLQRGGRAYLRDTDQRTESDLSALGIDTRADQSSHQTHRAVIFDGSGTRLAYLRQHGEQQWIVIRDLAGASETVLDPGTGNVWRMGFEPDGDYLRVQITVGDTNGNGRIEWPTPVEEGPKPCVGPVPSFNVFDVPGDQPETRLLRLLDGQLLETPELVMTLGTSVVTRNSVGELWLGAPTGEMQLISPKECAGRIYHSSAKHSAIVFGCSPTYGGRRELFVSTPSMQKKLGLDVAPFEVDGRLPGDSDLIGLYPRNDAYLLDLPRLALTPLPPQTQVLATHDRKALATRDNQLLILSVAYDGDRPQLREHALGLKRPPLSAVGWAGHYVYVGPVLIDLNLESVVRTFTSPPLALSQSGAALLPAVQRASSESLLLGPLTWTAE
jgi:hypothetical protein